MPPFRDVQPLAAANKRRWAAAFDEHHTSMSLHSAEQQGDVALKAHVARVYVSIVSEICCMCFIWMLQK
jgi:hypothetical protein